MWHCGWNREIGWVPSYTKGPQGANWVLNGVARGSQGIFGWWWWDWDLSKLLQFVGKEVWSILPLTKAKQGTAGGNLRVSSPIFRRCLNCRGSGFKAASVRWFWLQSSCQGVPQDVSACGGWRWSWSSKQIPNCGRSTWRPGESKRQQHVPFRKDCRVCLESMGTTYPHRRSNSTFFLHYVCGFVRALPGWSRSGYGEVLPVQVVPVTVLHELPVAHVLPDLRPEDVEEAPELPEEESKEHAEEVGQDDVNGLNEKANIEEMAEPASVQNITLVELVQYRHVDHLVAAMPKLHTKYRMLGINAMRLHSDRERAFLIILARQAAEVVWTAPVGPNGDFRGWPCRKRPDAKLRWDSWKDVTRCASHSAWHFDMDNRQGASLEHAPSDRKIERKWKKSSSWCY